VRSTRLAGGSGRVLGGVERRACMSVEQEHGRSTIAAVGKRQPEQGAQLSR
jgi:hypothetical protein